MDEPKITGAGGTQGGLGMFFAGLILAAAGAYLLTNQVTITTSYWNFYGHNAFGLSLLPLVIGIGFLFFSGKSIIGWVLTIAGALIVFLGIITHMDMYFRPTSLFNTILMLAMLTGGLGLIARAIRPAKE